MFVSISITRLDVPYVISKIRATVKGDRDGYSNRGDHCHTLVANYVKAGHTGTVYFTGIKNRVAHSFVVKDEKIVIDSNRGNIGKYVVGTYDEDLIIAKVPTEKFL